MNIYEDLLLSKNKQIKLINELINFEEIYIRTRFLLCVTSFVPPEERRVALLIMIKYNKKCEIMN